MDGGRGVAFFSFLSEGDVFSCTFFFFSSLGVKQKISGAKARLQRRRIQITGAVTAWQT